MPEQMPKVANNTLNSTIYQIINKFVVVIVIKKTLDGITRPNLYYRYPDTHSNTGAKVRRPIAVAC